MNSIYSGARLTFLCGRDAGTAFVAYDEYLCGSTKEQNLVFTC